MTKRIETGKQSSKFHRAMRCGNFCVWFCCILSLALGQLKPVMNIEEDHEILITVISMVHESEKYINFIIYLGDQAQSYRSFPKLLMDTFERPVIVAGSDIGELQNIINSRNLAVVILNGIEDPIFTRLEKSFTNIKDTHIIFVYRSRSDSIYRISYMEYFFKSCKDTHFYNVILIYKWKDNYQLFTYVLSPKIHIDKFTLKVLDEVIRSPSKAHKRFDRSRALVAINQRTPEAFLYNTRDGQAVLGGSSGLMLKEFMSAFNGEMDFLPMTFDEYRKLVKEDYAKNHDVTISASVHAYSTLDLNMPVVMPTRNCIILPNKRMVSIKDYIWNSSISWSILAFLLFYSIVNALIKRIGNPRRPWSNILFETYRLALSQSMSNGNLHQARVSEKWVIICANIFNVISTSLFTGVLATKLTTGIYKPEIVDEETFLASDLNIMVHPMQLETLFDSIPKSLNNRLIIVPRETWLHHLHSLNDSYAYVMMTHHFFEIDFKQERLAEPKLRVAPEKLCGVPHYLRFYVQPGAIFLRSLRHFMMHAFETGLTEKWKDMGMNQAEQHDLVHRVRDDSSTFKPMPVEYISTSLRIFCICLVASTVVFVLELLYSRCRRNRNNVIIV